MKAVTPFSLSPPQIEVLAKGYRRARDAAAFIAGQMAEPELLEDIVGAASASLQRSLKAELLSRGCTDRDLDRWIGFVLRKAAVMDAIARMPAEGRA